MGLLLVELLYVYNLELGDSTKWRKEGSYATSAPAQAVGTFDIVIFFKSCYSFLNLLLPYKNLFRGH